MIALRLAPLFLLGLTACYMEVHENEDAAQDDRKTDVVKLRDDARGCDDNDRSFDGRGEKGAQCFKNDDFTWRTSCRSSSCQAVKVFTHYMIQDDLGSGHPVHVEAFDNPYFQGSPRGSVRLTNFPARSGEWQEADLYLEPGEYYLLAYMTTDENDVVRPYAFRGMALVQDAPVGVYGALSSAQLVRVAPRAQNPYPAPVHIYLDRQFKAPGAEPDTHAHIRLQLSFAESGNESFKIPDGRNVKIRLHSSLDLKATPIREFAMPTSLFLVSGRVGRAEYLTPSLPVGDYIVFAYMDGNGNEFHDDGEPSAVHKVNNIATAVRVTENRTESLSLSLSPEPAL